MRLTERRFSTLRRDPAGRIALEWIKMHYVSTRGEAPTLGFSDAVLAGLARDGGLYVPARMAALSAQRKSAPCAA